MDKEPEKVTKKDAAQLESAEAKAHGAVAKGSMAAKAQSIADRHEKTDCCLEKPNRHRHNIVLLMPDGCSLVYSMV